VKHECSDIKLSVNMWGSVLENSSMLINFITSIHNVIKKYDTIKDEGSCRKTKEVINNDEGFDGKYE